MDELITKNTKDTKDTKGHQENLCPTGISFGHVLCVLGDFLVVKR